jgi:hypothetical protein
MLKIQVECNQNFGEWFYLHICVYIILDLQQKQKWTIGKQLITVRSGNEIKMFFILFICTRFLLLKDMGIYGYMQRMHESIP